MWVTQTYLGDVERDAKLFVYYLYEDYNSEQTDLTEAIQRHLEKLGEVYGDKVSLMMPNARFAGAIESQVRDFPKLWAEVRELLPGLLLSPVPLVELRASHKGCNFIPFKNGTPKHLANVVRSVRELADAAVSNTAQESEEKPSWIRRIADAVELKPGIWGIRLDLRRLLE
jgi:hypothetical protein